MAEIQKNYRQLGFMTNFVYQIIGRTSLCFDWIRRLYESFKKRESGINPSEDLDKTGRVVHEPRPLEIWWQDAEIFYVNHDSFGHSFWRAQEFSLFAAHRSLLERPLLDFGCGDGSFASVLFTEIEYGVDIDTEALQTAARYGVHKATVQSTNSSIPLPDHSVRSIISNSVLEHLSNLAQMLTEINRILVAGGIFMFTVPVKQLTRDLTKYYGTRESTRINHDFYHRNLLEVQEWEELLKRQGFEIMLLKQFQPDWFTFYFRMFRLLGDRGLGVLFPNIRERVWRRYKSQLVEMVRRSIRDTTIGANIFVVAKKY